MNKADLALLTPAEMAKADQLTIAGGMPEAVLVEQAGQAVTAAILRRFAARPTLVLAGPGNNGADARIVYHRLKEAGWPVRLVEGAGLKPDAIGDARLIVDGIFGAGLSRDISGPIAELIDAVTARAIPVVAIDVPSGLDGATGQVRGTAFRARLTVTFFRRKPGHWLLPGRELCGETELAQIGIAPAVLTAIAPQCHQNGPALWQLPEAGMAAHKYTRGHALIVSGGPNNTGAARLAASAALKAAAGLVTIASPSAALPVHAVHLTAIMLRQVETAADLAATLTDPRFKSLLIGPAAGVNASTRAKVEAAFSGRAALVLDADALTVFAGDSKALLNLIQNFKNPVVLTPHEGEFARLFSNLRLKSESKLERARKAAAASGATVLLKGADTVIAHPDGSTIINTNAPPWLATAGSGDVLAGIITGLLARGLEGFEAAAAGAWVHGQAAQTAGPGLCAEDISSAIPASI
jgi:ADP-dependent NAD(P)H-hydrate dehydratase / NAD(P)H-hydrate epimerase